MQADLLSPRGVQWPFSEFTLCNPLMTTPRPRAKGRRLAARSRLPVVTTGDSMHRIRSDDPPAMSMNTISSSSWDSCLSRNSLPQPPVHIDITHRPLPPLSGSIHRRIQRQVLEYPSPFCCGDGQPIQETSICFEACGNFRLPGSSRNTRHRRQADHRH